jgi:5'-nucleotidase
MTNTLYLDMDGVVADWEAGAAIVLGTPIKTEYVTDHYRHTATEWSRLRTAHRMYRSLPIMAHAQDLVALARQYRDRLGWELKFLTAVPKNDDVPWAFYDKVLWAQDHWADIPVMFGPHSTDKWRHCQLGDILVDDRADNCAAWTAAGGIAVRVSTRDIRPQIQQLQEDFDRRLAARG